MRNGVMIDKRDNVAVATYELKKGDKLEYPLPGDTSGAMGEVTLNEDVPLFHKVAVVDIPKGDMVIKYGEYIGVATKDIKRGDWVHTHNCASADDVKQESDKKLEAQNA